METAAEMIPVLTTWKSGTEKTIAWRATGANRSATSERKTILVNTSRDIAARSLGRFGDARAGALGIKKEMATLTSEAWSRCTVAHGRRTHIPGNNANMFGSVLPIQNGR